MKGELEQFAEVILNINPRYIDAFGTGLQGMAGMTPEGQATPANQVALELKRAVVDFAKAYASNDVLELKAIKKVIIGKIMILQTLDTLTEQQADELLDNLQELMQRRK